MTVQSCQREGRHEVSAVIQYRNFTPRHALLYRRRRELCIFIIDDALLDPSCFSRLDEQLHLALLVECREEVGALVDRVAESQQPVVLQDSALVTRSEGLGDVGAFFRCEDLGVLVRRLGSLERRTHDPAKVMVHRLVVVEQARVLGRDIDGPAESRPRFAVERVAVPSSLYFWSGVMDRRVDVEPGHLHPQRGSKLLYIQEDSR